jgi:hypothetical protein
MANRRRSTWPSFGTILKLCVTVLIVAPVAALVKAARVDSHGFPEEGTYKQQADFVNSLTSPCDPHTSGVVTSIIDADNPFQMVEAHTSEVNTVKVWHHEFDPEFGVVTRRTKESNKNAPAGSSAAVVDVEEVMIGGESQDGTLQPLTFRFKRDKNGLMRVVSKEKVPVTEFAEGVEQANKEGLVVRTNNCYTSQLRSRKGVS